jgi:hypothetical protein
MTLTTLQALLGWCSLINFGLVTIWFGLYVFAKDWLYGLHSRWFALSNERFEAIHYGGMAAYKLATWMFNFTPYLVLRFLI